MLEDLKPAVYIRNCKVRTLREQFDAADQQLLDAYLADLEGWTPYTLSKALGGKGFKIDHRVISAHRDGLCTCKEIGN